MGREIASVFGRWFALDAFPVPARVTAVCDLQPGLLDWFRSVPTITQFTTDYRELLQSSGVDVVYVAVPHHLHEEVYLQVLASGKDLLAEKPFGIDLAAACRIRDAAVRSGRFVRVSSEFPFLPGAQRAFQIARSGSSAPCSPSAAASSTQATWTRRSQSTGSARTSSAEGPAL